MSGPVYVTIGDEPVEVDPAKADELAALHREQCWAVTQPGAWVLANIAGAAVSTQLRPGETFVCTQHADHRGGHHACDGLGHVLVLWTRRKPEHRWVPERFQGGRP